MTCSVLLSGSAVCENEVVSAIQWRKWDKGVKKHVIINTRPTELGEWTGRNAKIVKEERSDALEEGIRGKADFWEIILSLLLNTKALRDSLYHHQHPPTREQLTQGPCPVNSLNIHEARQVCPHQDDISTSVLVSPVNAACLPVSPVDVRVQQSEAIGMLHWRQQGATVHTIEIRGLDPLQKERENHPILKTLFLLLALIVSSGSLGEWCYSGSPSLHSPYSQKSLHSPCSSNNLLKSFKAAFRLSNTQWQTMLKNRIRPQYVHQPRAAGTQPYPLPAH